MGREQILWCEAEARRPFGAVLALLLALFLGGCTEGSPGERAVRDAALFPDWVAQSVEQMKGRCPPDGGGAQVTLAVDVPADSRPAWAAVEASHGPMEEGEEALRFSGELGFRLDGEGRVEAVIVDCGRLRAASKLARASRSDTLPLPVQLAGTWVQEPVEDLGRTALRFAEMEGVAVVFIAPSFDPGRGDLTWEGPFPLEAGAEGAYSIDAEIGSLAEYRTKLFMDQRGRTLVAESNHLLGKGQAGLRLGTDGRLIASGLWIRSEWERWDDNGVPQEGRATPLETAYRRQAE